MDLAATHGRAETQPTPSTIPWVSEFRLGVTETLYDNGTSIIGYRVSDLRRRLSDVLYHRERERLIRDVAIEFFRHSLAIQLLGISESQFDLLTKQNNLVSNAYQQGVKTRKDYLRFKTQLRRADLDMVSARNRVETSKQQLFRLLAIPLEEVIAMKFVPDVQPDKLAGSPIAPVDLTTHFETKIADLEFEIEGSNVDLSKRSYWPELFVTSGLAYSSSGYLGGATTFSGNAVTSWNALVLLKYNFWDWGIRRRNVAIAETATVYPTQYNPRPIDGASLGSSEAGSGPEPTQRNLHVERRTSGTRKKEL